MTNANMPLLNGQRLETDRRTVGEVTVHRQIIRPADAAAAADVILAALKLDGSGSANLNVDGSVTSRAFYYQAPTSKLATIRSLSLSLSDDSAALAGGFGGLASLANGLAIEVVAVDTSILLDLTAGLGLKNHADAVALGAEMRITDTATGVDVVGIRWDFATPIELAAGQRFRVTVRDDLTGLSAARAIVGGHVFAA